MIRISRPASLRARIGLFVGALVTVFWIIAALTTSHLLFDEVNKAFDRELRVTADRILPIVLHERYDDDDDFDSRPSHEYKALRRLDDDDIEFIIISQTRGTILTSRNASDLTFPTEDGFHTIGEWRFYVDTARRGDVQIAIARPVEAREEIAAATLLALTWPLVIIIPLTLLGIALLVRRELRPLGTLEAEMSTRGPTNLTPIQPETLPSELVPVTESANRLLARIEAGFEAERSFASNAAHEMRTPLAGAIAQAQRLMSETDDPDAIARAREIESSLKRLGRYGEKLMQMARAEGARLRTGEPLDVRPVVQIVLEDFIRTHGADRFDLLLPETPVTSDLDPDAMGIVLRNLVENALTHGAPETPISVDLSPDRVLRVANDGPRLNAQTLARLQGRFMRGDGAGNGSGLGLSIVRIITERSNADFTLTSPRQAHDDGVEACFSF